MIDDPFQHVPELRGHIATGIHSNLRFTADALAAADAKARSAGWPEDWRRTDEAIASAWRAFSSARDGADDLWIFGYGSLMWDPGFRFAEVRRACVAGRRRRFTLEMEARPPFVDAPMLVTTLEPRPGACDGLAFRIPAELVPEEAAILWRRELLFFDYVAEDLELDTPQGVIRAVSFAPNPADPRYRGERTLEDTAAIIAAGRSVRGTNRAGLGRLADFLRLLGVEDDYVFDVEARVRARDR